jgi:Serine/threonine protein kinase
MLISGKYEVQSQLGQGGMGVVYKVRHIALETISALKVLPTHLMENPDLVKRFYREARVMAQLHHPHIVRVIDIHRDDALNFHYFVMEYIQGRTLRKYLQEKGPLSLREVIEIIRQIADALDYAHSYNPPVIHRDIKPTNIMIEDGSQRVVVMDFGIAKELDESEMTRAGIMLGTLKYCPPEQMRHEPLDGSADVYALGMVMYEAYTGTHLFAGLDENDVVRKVLNPEEYKPPFTRPTPAEFITLVTKAIAKTRTSRYRRMADLLGDLGTCWSALDKTKSVILPVAPVSDSGSGGGHDDLMVLEEQIHKLEEERERRRVLRLEAQVRESKEKAAREGAEQLASTLFQQGCALEERGREYWGQRQYDPARKAYEEAASLFGQACEKAIFEALVQQAGQARQEMAAVKHEADYYGAKERARSFYSRGLMLQAQAEELWEHQSYREAWQVYGEARSVFKDAHELAYRSLLEEEAKAAQHQIKAARELAVKEAADKFASEAFWEAVKGERRADTALGQGEFTQARELYRAALQQYELVQQQARSERQRREVVLAQQQAQQARAKAEAAGAGPEQDAYRQAREAQGRGDARLQGQDYEQAAQEYEQAHAGYEQAEQEAERARRLQAVVEARQRMEEVRAKAEQAGARGRCAEAFAQVEQKVVQGRKREQGEEFAAAAGLYEEAAQALSRLLEEAKLQAAREEAEAARQRLIEARERGAALRGWAKAAWKKADKEANQAEAAWQGQAYHRAVKLYERAVQAYGGAEAEALEERGRQRAQEARRQAEEAQKTAEKTQTQRYTQALYERAQEARRQGEQGLTAKRWEEATNTFIQTKALFDQSLQVAKRAKAGQAAEAAKKSALAAQRKAQEGGASALFPDAFAEAVALLHQAEQKLHQEDYGTAQAIFESSTALFLQICHDAMVSLQREQAQQARARAHEFQGRSSSVKKRQQRRAHKALDQGERLFQQGSFAEARVKYEEAISVLSAVLETSRAAPAERKVAFVSRPYFYVASILVLLSVVIVIYWVSLTPYRETLPKTGQPPEVKPSVVWWTPELEHELTLAEGQSQTFGVKATSPKNIPLRYAWFLNGEKKAEGEQWTYQPDFTEAGAKPKEVTAIVTDRDNHVVQKSWRVRVMDVNRRPTIQDVSPQIESVEMPAGDSREFSVRASDPDIDNHLLYVWSLDGKKVAEGERWQFRASSPKLSHKVSVEVVDQAGLKDQRAWDISVKAPLPSLTLPEIVQASPEVKQGEEITLAEGQNQTFAVKAESPQKSRLNYAWFLNDKKKAQGAQWTYQPNFAEAEKKAKEVKVVITDQGERKAEKIWQVRVQDVNRPPDIGVASPPPTDPVRMAGGGVQSFAVEVSDPDKDDNLVYRWLFDGQEVGRGQSWQLHAPSSEGKHTVEVKVSDKAGLTVQQAWNIIVQAPSLPPDITAAMPSAKIVGTEAGQSLDFSVAADLPGGMHESGKTLRYQWSIDNAAPQITPTGQFRFIETNPGTYQLTVVAISPEGLKSAPQSWSVEVRPQDIGIREAEVRNWLETYRRAWEEKNTESLVKLGESSQHAAKLREVLHGYKDFRVAFQDVKIRIAGNQATVTFSRVDTIDGQTLPQPDRKVITLEKQGDGRIVRRTAM